MVFLPVFFFVGKSVVIRALYQTLYRILKLKDWENPDDKRILLCAYMGFAAFNISGQTICSALHKKIYKCTNHLSADELNTFRIISPEFPPKTSQLYISKMLEALNLKKIMLKQGTDAR